MRIFSGSRCNQRLYLENVACNRCGAQLAFLPSSAC